MRIYKWLKMTTREIVRGPAVAAEADEEMRFHLAMETENNLRAGRAPDEARREALLAFGGVLRHQDVMRDEQPTRPLERLVHDVRFALRMLRKTPGFTFAAVLTLAVGIGGNTAVFSAVNGVLLHPLPYPNADRLVTIAHTTKGGGIPKNLPGSSATYVAYSPAKSFESMALYESFKMTLTGRDLPERLTVSHVTQNTFAVLGISSALGPRVQRRRGSAWRSERRPHQRRAVATSVRRRSHDHRTVGAPRWASEHDRGRDAEWLRVSQQGRPTLDADAARRPKTRGISHAVDRPAAPWRDARTS